MKRNIIMTMIAMWLAMLTTWAQGGLLVKGIVKGGFCYE